MAIFSYRDSRSVVRDPAKVAQALRDIGITYEVWGTGRMPKDLRLRDLGETEKAAVIQAFDPEIARLKRERGYRTVDVVSLYPETPGLDEHLAKYDRPHVHKDDEVRFVLHGRGVFVLYPEGRDAVEIELHPGDFISIPANFRHSFRLCEDRRITAIRLFTDPAGWVAHYLG